MLSDVILALLLLGFFAFGYYAVDCFVKYLDEHYRPYG